MPNFLIDLFYKFSIDAIWKIINQDWKSLLSSMGVAIGGYMLNQWLGTLIISISIFGIIGAIGRYIKTQLEKFNKFHLEEISKIKSLFEENNRIENRLLVGGFPFINIDLANKQLRVRTDIHNCSNQIIDCEIDVKNTRVIVNTQTHPLEEISPLVSIPPYSKIELWCSPVSLTSLAEEMNVEIKIQVKYGFQNQSNNLIATNYLETTLIKQDNNGQIIFLPKVKKN